MRSGWRLYLAAGLGILGSAIAARAVRIDPPAALPSDSFASYPAQVEELEAETKTPLPSLPAELFLELSKKAVGDHLLVTGRAVRPADSRVVAGSEEPEVHERPHHLHPATVFQTIMGGVILMVVASIVWFPALVRRSERGRRRERHSRRRRRVSRSARTPAQPGHRMRVRRRRRATVRQ